MKFPWRSRAQRGEELDEEIRAHLQMAIADRVARGESRADAERAARREFGNVAHVTEVTRDMWGGLWLERLGRDLRYAARGLRRAPGFTAVALLTLALGIGANTAIFTVVNGVLLRPLPFPHAERLFLVSHRPTSGPFEMPPSLDEATYLTFHGASVTADFMGVLGVSAALGRGFVAGEDTPGGNHVAILGDELWHSAFAGDSAIVGRRIILDGVPHTVIGVMPPRFAFPYDAQVWTPLLVATDPHNSYSRPVVGRLRSGVGPNDARLELERIVAGRHLPNDKAVSQVLPLKELLTAKVEKSLLVFAGAVAFVLLIACANVANLLLIRAATRRHELAVRAALGATRATLVRLMLSESAIVALLGGAIGVLVSVLGVRILVAAAPAARLPRPENIHVDGWVLGAALGMSLLAGLACGLAPALATARRDLRDAIGEGARTLTGGHERLRRGLIITELALAIVLLTGAGLLTRSLARIRAVEPGFEPTGRAAMIVNLPDAAYPTPQRRRAFHAAALDRLARVPGTESVGAVNWAPLTPQLIAGDFQIDRGAATPCRCLVDKMVASPDYFRTMGIAFLYGRDFTAQDDERAPGVVIVSRSVAKKFWPPSGEEAIGKRVSMADKPKPEDWLTIVGVVDDVVQQSFAKEREPALYQPIAQSTVPFFLGTMTFVARTSADLGATAAAMRAVVRDLDANLPVQRITTIDELISSTIAEPRFEARLLATFSLLALLLAAIGTYGVLAYDVAARTHEIGLRMALGAMRVDVMAVVLRRAARVAVTGVVLGVAGALALTRVLSKSLFEVKPNDPLTFASVAALVVAVSLLAALVPARRATRVDPLVALRHE